MLQKCAYAILSHQELSAQQVASWLTGGGDHYTGHSFRNLYWTAFEASINTEKPSPECYKTWNSTLADQVNDVGNNTDTDDDDTSENEHPEVRKENAPCTSLEVENNEKSDSESNDDNDNDDTQEADTNDVRLSFSRNGHIFECSSQVEDYRFRAEELNHISVWDFVSTVDQVPKSTNQTGEDYNELEGPGGNSVDDDNYDDDDNDMSIHDHKTNAGPYKLQMEHRDYVRKVQRVRTHHWKHFVPVPIGPALPLRDRPELYPKYTRLMLILFNLRGNAKDWPEAFSRFVESCTPETRQILDNIQLLHECKDSNQSLQKKRNKAMDRERQATHNEDNSEADMNEIIDHIDSVENYYSRAIAESHANVDDCVWELQAAGLFSHTEHDHISPVQTVENTETIMLPDDDLLEDQWKSTYENRRNEWKRKLGNTHIEAPLVYPTHHRQSMVVMSTTDVSSTSAGHQVMQLTVPPPNVPDIPIDDVINEWSLNTEQARAFRIIALHSTDRKLKPLRMYIGGPGGTGKSRVIHALTDFFERRGEPRRLRLASFTGAAAKNIGGTTLHTALCLNPAKNNITGTKTRSDLIAMWDGVDHLLIDEVSMIGCHMMADIHDALVNATGCTEPFGGINMIFASDFAQLPPVGDTKLYTHLNYRKLHIDSPSGQKTVFGKLLWHSVDTVILLNEQMQQTGEANTEFHQETQLCCVELCRAMVGLCSPTQQSCVS